MKNILILLGLVAIAAVKGDSLGDAGTFVANFNYGTCLSLVDNANNDRDTCLVSCKESSSVITTLFTSS